MLKSERGVTLIELIMALAIVGLLATSVLFGRDRMLGRQQFVQGVDQVVETLSSARNQATGTVGNTDAGDPSRGTTNSYIYAKTVELTSGSSNIRVSTETITCGNFPDCNSGGVVADHHLDPYTVKIPWNVRPNATAAVLFGIQTGGVGTVSGTVQAYWGAAVPTGGPQNGGLAQITSPTVVATLTNNQGYQATITIDQFGNVTRQIL